MLLKTHPDRKNKLVNLGPRFKTLLRPPLNKTEDDSISNMPTNQINGVVA